MGVKRKQRSLGDQQIGQAEQREELRRVPGQSAIAKILKAQNVLDDVKRMLDLVRYSGSMTSLRSRT